MDYYKIAEKVQIVKWYFQGYTFRQILKLFPLAYEDRVTPSLKTVCRVLKNFGNCGCVSPRYHKQEPVSEETRELNHLICTNAEKVQIVKWYYQGNKFGQILKLFPVAYENSAIPSLKTLRRVLKNFGNLGCVSPSHHKKQPVPGETWELKHIGICSTVNNPMTSSNQVDEVDIKRELVNPDILKNEPLDLMPEFSEETKVLLIQNDVNPHIVKSEPQDLISEAYEETPLVSSPPPKGTPAPTSKSKNSKLDDRIVCRLCLKPTSRTTAMTLTEINLNYPGKSDNFKRQKLQEAQSVTNMLRFCVPLVDYTLTFNPAICSICCNRLQSTYEFITMCNSSQNTIKQYKKLHFVSESVVNIDDVIEYDTRKQTPLQEDQQPSPKKRKTCQESEKDFVKDTYSQPYSNSADTSLDIKDEVIDYPDMIKIDPEEEVRPIYPDLSTTTCEQNAKKDISDFASPQYGASCQDDIDDKSNIKFSGNSDMPDQQTSSFRRNILNEAQSQLVYIVPSNLNLPVVSPLYCVQNVPNLKRDDVNPEFS